MAALALLTVCGLSSCGGKKEAAKGRVKVVATTPLVADLVRNVGGDQVAVTTLLPANADPHDYEPRPSDVKTLGRTHLVISSGGAIDNWLNRAIKNSGANATVVELLAGVKQLQSGGEVDPHWWHDPTNVNLAVERIGSALAKAMPSAANEFAKAGVSYRQKVRSLDKAIHACFNKVPIAQRKLVTTHEALGYLARRYQLDFVGTVIPSQSSVAEASAGSVKELVSRIKKQRVRVIFPERGGGSKIESAVATEAKVKLGAPIWTDAIGPVGQDSGTYIKAMAANASALVSGFSDGQITCSLQGKS
jgi:ABC-type Zn uptake system ZnuABC Zn-binding protein ZnuA